MKWADQVMPTLEKWKPTVHFYLYSMHFEDDFCQPHSKIAESVVVGRVGVLLKKGAIITVLRGHDQTSGRSIHQNQQQKGQEQL